MKDTKGTRCGNRLVSILSAVQCRTDMHVGHSRFPSDLSNVNMQKADTACSSAGSEILLPCLICSFVR